MCKLRDRRGHSDVDLPPVRLGVAPAVLRARAVTLSDRTHV